MKTIGKYQVADEIGRSPAGVTCRVRDPFRNRDFALKMLSPLAALSAASKDQLYRDLATSWNLSHRHIAKVHDVGELEGGVYIATELLVGNSLGHFLSTHNVRIGDKLALLAQVCEALACAHSQGLAHGNLKPGNIFVTDAGNAAILDFGTGTWQTLLLSSGVRLNGLLTNYLAPEQILGQPFDARSDIFSVGIILYEALRGQYPFQAPAGLIPREIVHTDPEPLRAWNTLIPAELEEIVTRALKKDPKDRIQTADEFAANLYVLAQHLRREPPAPREDIPAPLTVSSAAPAPEAPPSLAPAPPEDQPVAVAPPAAEPIPAPPAPAEVEPIPAATAFALPPAAVEPISAATALAPPAAVEPIPAATAFAPPPVTTTPAVEHVIPHVPPPVPEPIPSSPVTVVSAAPPSPIPAVPPALAPTRVAGAALWQPPAPPAAKPQKPTSRKLVTFGIGAVMALSMIGVIVVRQNQGATPGNAQGSLHPAGANTQTEQPASSPAHAKPTPFENAPAAQPAPSAAVPPAPVELEPEQVLRGQVRPLWEAGQYAQAMRLVDEVLTQSPANAEARSWKKKIRAAQEAEAAVK